MDAISILIAAIVIILGYYLAFCKDRVEIVTGPAEVQEQQK